MSSTKQSRNIQISESAANLGTWGRLGMAWPEPLAPGNAHSHGSVWIWVISEYFTGGDKAGMHKTNGVFRNIFQSVIKFLSFSVVGAEGKRTGAENPPGCALLCLELLLQEGMSRSGSRDCFGRSEVRNIPKWEPAIQGTGKNPEWMATLNSIG